VEGVREEGGSLLWRPGGVVSLIPSNFMATSILNLKHFLDISFASRFPRKVDFLGLFSRAAS